MLLVAHCFNGVGSILKSGCEMEKNENEIGKNDTKA